MSDDEDDIDRQIAALEKQKRTLLKKNKFKALKAEVAALSAEAAIPAPRPAPAAAAAIPRPRRRPPVVPSVPAKGFRFTDRQVKGARTEWKPVGNLVLSDSTVKTMADRIFRELREVSGTARIQLKFKSSLNASSSPDLILVKEAGQRLTREAIAAQLNARLAQIAGGSDGVWELTSVVLLKRTGAN